jgi:DeoR/GlpR family transcriptional regulator of sugar metabolism
MNKKLFVEERRLKIVDYVKRLNRANVTELAQNLNVTEATIRRDLILLEDKGLIHRTHGGVISRHDSPVFWQTTRIEKRLIIYKEEKERIADFISHLVADNESVILDGGTSVLLVAEKLVDKTDLVIVTNSPAIGAVFLQHSHHHVILLGGEMMRESYTTTGTTTEEELRNIRVDKAIIGATAIIPESGLFCVSPREAGVKRQMILASKETIVASDSSKFNNRALCLFSDFGQIKKLVTDKNINTRVLDILKEKGVEVFTV